MFKKYMQNLSKEQLLAAFEELQEMKSTGVLDGDVVRGLIGV